MISLQPNKAGFTHGAVLSRHHVFHLLLFMLAYAVFTAYLKPNRQHDVSVVVPVTATATPPVIDTPSAPVNAPAVIASVSSPVTASPSTGRHVEAMPEVVASVTIDYSSRVSPVMQLQRMAEDDEHAENRLAAVRQLSEMAATGEQSASIQRALQNASTDADEAVAMAARAAYNDFKARQQPR